MAKSKKYLVQVEAIFITMATGIMSHIISDGQYTVCQSNAEERSKTYADWTNKWQV